MGSRYHNPYVGMVPKTRWQWQQPQISLVPRPSYFVWVSQERGNEANNELTKWTGNSTVHKEPRSILTETIALTLNLNTSCCFSGGNADSKAAWAAVALGPWESHIPATQQPISVRKWGASPFRIFSVQTLSDLWLASLTLWSLSCKTITKLVNNPIRNKHQLYKCISLIYMYVCTCMCVCVSCGEFVLKRFQYRHNLIISALITNKRLSHQRSDKTKNFKTTISDSRWLKSQLTLTMVQ